MTEFDRSAVVMSAQMEVGSGWFFIAILFDPRSGQDLLRPNVPTLDPSEPILLSSTRIEASCSVDRSTLNAAIDSLYLRLNLLQTVVDRYESMEAALEQRMIQKRQLSEDLKELRTSASPFFQLSQRSTTACAFAMKMRSSSPKRFGRRWPTGSTRPP
uniref:Uncharacterized protein n=1 Tax=Peronospora matthiolae TaxID=2874970 RepID=A0AAV1VAF1_9STRA